MYAETAGAHDTNPWSGGAGELLRIGDAVHEFS
jgi:hypothetical protein